MYKLIIICLIFLSSCIISSSNDHQCIDGAEKIYEGFFSPHCYQCSGERWMRVKCNKLESFNEDE